MRRFLVILLTIFVLLGFSRTPEAQVGGIVVGIVAPIVVGVTVGGCAHTALKSPAEPLAPMPPAETGG
jgi:hypothetical protein